MKFLEELQQKSSDDDDVLTPMCRVEGEDAEEKAAKKEVSRIMNKANTYKSRARHT